ncbi:hypothetical protein GCM10022224_034400 [Nonomuraea antimicrobica]|uniref:O-methyltransferase dimerisation domain-containing protein n=1 Tax=Nonomuraea antimicrobica TaxID=561173 RepID=A0ABP7BQH1_9ACTN
MSDQSQGLSYLMDLIIGSSAGAVLAAAIDLNVVPVLSSHPERLSAAELGKVLNLDERSSSQFLTAMACLGLVMAEDGRYRVSELSSRAAARLRSGPGSRHGRHGACMLRPTTGRAQG